MRVVFYNLEPSVNRLAVTTTDKSVDKLKAEGVISAGCNGVAVDINWDKPTATDDHWAAMVMHVNYTKFDSLANPKTVVPDYDLLEFAVTEDVRLLRQDALQQLDLLQTRALLKEKPEVVAMIEADKQVLRDATAKISAGSNKSFISLRNSIPAALYVNYHSKYHELLK